MSLTFLIPGLSMAASELPEFPAQIRLENPEVGTAPRWDRAYTLEEVAEYHLKNMRQKIGANDQVLIIGMSMGAMIGSILASHFRNQLPTKTRFSFLVTSANSPTCPAIPPLRERGWLSVKGGDIDDFRRMVSEFFSEKFCAEHPEKVEAYAAYRATGKNRQSATAFFRQAAALKNFRGKEYFPKTDPAEVRFVHGESDRLLEKPHADELRVLTPNAHHSSIKHLGHMVNIEMPSLFIDGNW